MTLLFAWAIAPHTVAASCGDSTARRESSNHSVLDTRELRSESKSMLYGMERRDFPGTPLPCSGPTCSGQKRIPIPIPPPGAITAELWCDTTWLLRSSAPEPTAGLLDRPLLWPPQRTSEHSPPPRLPIG